MKSSKFSLSHYKLFSSDMGELVPIGLTEVIPGDVFRHNTSLLLRCSPLVAPVMHPVYVQLHHWFVPHRLVWESFEDFITGGPDGDDASVFPTITMPAVTGAAIGSLADYLGVPTGVANLECSALPFRGYVMIFNEWYRDQDLQTVVAMSKASGADSTTSTALLHADWEKDYFTSARPWAQKGPTVTLPLGDTAPIEADGNFLLKSGATTRGFGFSASSGWVEGVGTGTSAIAGPMQYNSGLLADLSAATATDVNDIRLAFALQRYEENRARHGSRYTEYLRAAFGVRSSDARLQRPEYLGGGRQTIQFSEILQTAPGVSETPEDFDVVGDMKGHGIAALRSNRYQRFFEEHGYVFTFMTVRPKTMYVQGLPRTWNRRTKEDFFQYELQHIGQQEILNKELYAAHASPNATFGFQDRYDEYRRQESTIGGEFRDTLDYWHMARIFSSAPTLNSSFVAAVPTKRNFAVQDNDVLWCMANHTIHARRKVAKFANSFIY